MRVLGVKYDERSKEFIKRINMIIGPVGGRVQQRALLRLPNPTETGSGWGRGKTANTWLWI